MKFDRTVPGGSVEAECRLEGGKAVLEWAFHLIRNTGGRDRRITIPLRDEEARDCLREEQGYIRLILTDKQNRMVLECVQKLGEEEPLRSVLLRPDLWKGIREPCLYGMEAILADGGGRLVDRIRGQLALRCLAVNARDGEMRLNNESFVPKTVRYALPETGTEAAMQRQMLEDSTHRAAAMEWSADIRAGMTDLFAGKIFCADCEKRMYYKRQRIQCKTPAAAESRRRGRLFCNYVIVTALWCFREGRHNRDMFGYMGRRWCFRHLQGRISPYSGGKGTASFYPAAVGRRRCFTNIVRSGPRRPLSI